MKKLLLILSILFIANTVMAKEYVEFNFPNDGWHKVSSPDGVETKKCFVPNNQTAENYTEMLIFYERILKNTDITPITILHRQLGKDRTNYPDIIPEYIRTNSMDSMVTWCSQMKNTCSVERALKSSNGVILILYVNKMPHYSQNMFGQWSNIINTVKLYTPQESETVLPKNIIEL